MADIQLLFQTFNKNAKRKEKTKWWKNLDDLVTTQESTTPTDIRIPSDDIDTLTGIIHAFQEISRVKKPHSDTNSSRAITLFQCLFRIHITNECATTNGNCGISAFVKAINRASHTFANNEECMEILVSWTREWMDTGSGDDDEVLLMPYLASVGALLIGASLNEDFPCILQRQAAYVCEMLLNSTSVDDLKSYLDDKSVQRIGWTIQNCGDWYLQYVLLQWMSAYYMNCKLCLQGNASQTKTLKKIETAFYKGLFEGIKSVERSKDLRGIKQGIKDKVNKKLFYLTQNEYNENYANKQQTVSDILSHYNEVMYPNNTVWTLHIAQAWIYHNENNDEHYFGAFQLHLGAKLLYIQYAEKEEKNLTVLWDGITKFEYDENTLLCWIHFADFTEQEATLYEGSCDNIRHIKFQSDNRDNFETLTQDIINNLPKKAVIGAISKREEERKSLQKGKKSTKTYKKKKKKTPIRKEEEPESVTLNTHSKRKRRRKRRKSNKKQNINDTKQENETAADEKEDERNLMAVDTLHHIVTCTDNTQTKSCDIDLTSIEPECGDFIRFKSTGQSQWEYGRVILKKGSALDVKVFGATDTAREIDIKEIECEVVNEAEREQILKEHQEKQMDKMEIDGEEIPETDTNENNMNEAEENKAEVSANEEGKKEKEATILVPDSDLSQSHSQANTEVEDHEFVSRPLMHPVQCPEPQPYEAPPPPHKPPPPVSLVRSTKVSKRVHKRSPTKWRPRPPLRLESARNKNKKQKKELPLQPITDIAMNEGNINMDRFHEYNGRKRKQFEYDANENMNAPPKKKRKRVSVEEKQTQTEGNGAMRVDINQIESEISSRFKILFENLFRDKLEEMRNDNDEFRQFLRGKVSETNDIQNDYNLKMKQVQSEIFNKFRNEILKKWKDDAMDVCDQLDDHATNIHNQNRGGNMERNNSSDDIVLQIKSLLNNYNQE